MPYFWTESDSGVPSDSPPKLTGKKKLLESLPKPRWFRANRYDAAQRLLERCRLYIGGCPDDEHQNGFRWWA